MNRRSLLALIGLSPVLPIALKAGDAGGVIERAQFSELVIVSGNADLFRGTESQVVITHEPVSLQFVGLERAS